MIAGKKACQRWLERQPDDGLYEVRKATKKRSRSQNNYYHKLLGQLAGVLGLTNEELHFMLLKDYSTMSRWATLDNVDVSHVHSFKYREVYAREGHTIYYNVWKPSSEMTTVEFKRLLDGLIRECQEVGIETATNEELALMREE